MEAVGIKQPTEKAICDNLTNLEKQKVAIIRSLIRNPKIILGYEPAGHLDMIGTKITYDLFRRMSRNKLIIIATHDVEMARKYGDRVIDIKAGKVVSDTNTAEVTQVAENFGLIESKLPLKEVFTSAIENIFSSLAGLIITFTAIFFFLVSTGFYFGFNNKTLQNEH